MKQPSLLQTKSFRRQQLRLSSTLPPVREFSQELREGRLGAQLPGSCAQSSVPAHNFPELWTHRVVCGPPGPGRVPAVPQGHISPPALSLRFPLTCWAHPKPQAPGGHLSTPVSLGSQTVQAPGPLDLCMHSFLVPPLSGISNPSVSLGRTISVTLSPQSTE